MDVSELVLSIVTTIVFIWDFLTWPIYQAIYQPWEKRKKFSETKAKCIKRTQVCKIT